METRDVNRTRIVRVTCEGLKAFDRDLALSSLNLLLGEPGAGKSTIPEAVRFAALGCIPALGGREIDTARILRGVRMAVRVELSDGRWFTRTLARDGSSLRQEARTSWLPASTTSTAHGGAIRALFGDSEEEAAEHLDLRELLDASPAQRAAKIDALLSATASTPEAMAAHVEVLAVARLGKLDERGIPSDPAARKTLVSGLLPALSAGVRAALPPAIAATLGELRNKGIPTALERANAEKRTASENVRRRSSAQAELEDRAREAAAPASTLADLDRRRQAATDQLAVLKANRDRAANSQAARAAAEAKLKEAKGTTVDHEKVRQGIAEARAHAERWERQAAELQVEIPEVPLPELAETDPKTEKAAKAAEAKAAKLDAEAKEIEATPAPISLPFDAVPSTDGPTEVYRQRKEAVRVASDDPWTKASGLLTALAAYGFECAGGPLKLAGPFRELVALAKANGADLEKAEAELGEAIRALDAARDARAAAEKRNAEIHEANQRDAKAHGETLARARQVRAEATKLRDQARDIRAKETARVAELNRDAQAAYAVAVGERSAKVEAQKTRRENLLQRAAKTREDADADEKAIVAEEAEVEKAQARLDGIGDVEPFDVGSADQEIADLNKAISTIDAQKREVEGADARKRELGSLVEAIAEAQAAEAVWTSIEAALKRVRELDLSDRAEPILARMRRFLEGAGRKEVPYLRATKTATDFGWRRGGQELSVEALSGGETVLFTTALAAAVIALRAPACRVLLVEAAELGDREAANQVLAGIQAVASELDSVIVATCAEVSTPNGWRGFVFNGSGPVAETDRS